MMKHEGVPMSAPSCFLSLCGGKVFGPIVWISEEICTFDDENEMTDEFLCTTRTPISAHEA